MKIEKVNDRQIRCTLSKKELEQRDLKLTEIAYGNEKVKALFKDMMAAASIQFGFEADDIPLMIEVIPFPDSCVVMITKVEDPEELDTRFSKFAPSVQSQEGPIATLTEMFKDIDGKNDELSELFKKLQSKSEELKEVKEKLEEKQENPAKTSKAKESKGTDSKKEEAELPKELIVYFEFEKINDFIVVSKQLKGFKLGHSNLYKNPKTGKYLLEIDDFGIDRVDFLKVCNIISEFGDNLREIGGMTRFFVKEHFDLVIALNAIDSIIENM